MKIVHVLSPLTKGGGEKMAVDLSNRFAKEGHEVAIVAAYPADPLLLQDAIKPMVDLRFVRSSPSRLGAYLSMVPWVLRNWKWLASRDILHVHLTFGAVFGTLVKVVRRLAACSGPAVIETYHAVGTPIPPLDRRLHTWMATTRDGFALMARDDHWTGFVKRHPRIHSAVIPNGIDLEMAPPRKDEIRAYRECAGLPPDVLVMGTVGRLVPGRKPELLIPVFAKVAHQMGDGVHFLIAGEGPLTDRVRNLARSAGLEGRVHFPGLAVRPVLPFSVIDLYVSLNVGPITGIAALEAAAFGLPIVSVQLREHHVRSADDWIFSSADPEELGTEAAKLLGDPAARGILAARQREHVHVHHSVQTMADAYITLYRAALHENQATRSKLD